MAAISTIAAVAGAGAAVAGAVGNAKAAKKANATAERAADNQLEIANRQEDRSDEQWQIFRDTYLPVQKQLLEEAKGLGSIANQNHQAQQAAGDVAGTFAQARENLAETPGLNPNSDAYMRQANRLNLQEAATSAAAQTGARQQTRTQANAQLKDAVSIGSGLPSSSAAMLAQAGAGFGSAASFAARQAEGSQARSDAGFGAAGRVVGGLSQSKAFQGWLNSGSSGGGVTPPNPYAASGMPPNPFATPAAPTAEELQFAGAGAFA
jgi:hypothetical protein